KQYWFTVKTGLPTNKIRLVFEDSKKNIWVASRTKGIFKINKDGSTTNLMGKEIILREKTELHF
ncbi:MAG: hypothetical protein L3J74_09855, partial [Bacteroidales bacterium]|nr:hypothetical protein [Bacteroidales bacterium]